MKVKSESEVTQSVQLLATSWTAAYQAPPSIGFSRQEYWSGVPLPSPIWGPYIFRNLENLASPFSPLMITDTSLYSLHKPTSFSPPVEGKAEPL